MDLFTNTQLLRKTYSNILDDLLKTYKITKNEIKILLFISENDNYNTAKDIAQKLMITKSHVSLSIYKLYQKGLINKIQDLSDKKLIHIILTDKSKIIIKEANIKQQEFFNIIFKDVTNEEKQTINSILEKIQKNIILYNS